MEGAQHIFIHPWLDREESWGALVVSAGTPAAPACLATLQALCKADADDNPGAMLPWFIPAAWVDEPGDWPLERTVFVIDAPADSLNDTSWQTHAGAIRGAGGKVGVAVLPNEALPPPGGPWDVVFLEAAHARTTPPVKLMVLAAQGSIALSGVRSRQDFEWGLANRIALLNAEFLQARTREASKPDVMRAHLLQLLSLITQDADTREIEAVFKTEPKLSYSLLRLVNSAALGLRTQVTSFSQAISLLGRRQLQRWLQLLVYADPGGSGRPNPLLQWAAMRGRLLELAFQHIDPPPQLAISPDSAFMTGIFSLLDVLLNLPMEDILAQLPVASPVKLALTERIGPLGELLSAVEDAERRKFATASTTLAALGIGGTAFLQAQADAIAWAGNVSRQAG